MRLEWSFGTRSYLLTMLNLNFALMAEGNHCKESNIVRISFRKRAML